MRIKWNRHLDGTSSRRQEGEGDATAKEGKENKKGILRIFRRKKKGEKNPGDGPVANVEEEDSASVSSVATCSSQPVSEGFSRDRSHSLFSSFRLSLPGYRRKKRKVAPISDTLFTTAEDEPQVERYSTPDLRRGPDAPADMHSSLSTSSPSVRCQKPSAGRLSTASPKLSKSVSFSGCQRYSSADLPPRAAAVTDGGCGELKSELSARSSANPPLSYESSFASVDGSAARTPAVDAPDMTKTNVERCSSSGSVSRKTHEISNLLSGITSEICAHDFKDVCSPKCEVSGALSDTQGVSIESGYSSVDPMCKEPPTANGLCCGDSTIPNGAFKSDKYKRNTTDCDNRSKDIDNLPVSSGRRSDIPIVPNGVFKSDNPERNTRYSYDNRTKNTVHLPNNSAGSSCKSDASLILNCAFKSDKSETNVSDSYDNLQNNCAKNTNNLSNISVSSGRKLDTLPIPNGAFKSDKLEWNKRDSCDKVQYDYVNQNVSSPNYSSQYDDKRRMCIKESDAALLTNFHDFSDPNIGKKDSVSVNSASSPSPVHVNSNDKCCKYDIKGNKQVLCRLKVFETGSKNDSFRSESSFSEKNIPVGKKLRANFDVSSEGAANSVNTYSSDIHISESFSKNKLANSLESLNSFGSKEFLKDQDVLDPCEDYSTNLEKCKSLGGENVPEFELSLLEFEEMCNKYMSVPNETKFLRYELLDGGMPPKLKSVLNLNFPLEHGNFRNHNEEALKTLNNGIKSVLCKADEIIKNDVEAHGKARSVADLYSLPSLPKQWINFENSDESKRTREAVSNGVQCTEVRGKNLCQKPSPGAVMHGESDSESVDVPEILSTLESESGSKDALDKVEIYSTVPESSDTSDKTAAEVTGSVADKGKCSSAVPGDKRIWDRIGSCSALEKSRDLNVLDESGEDSIVRETENALHGIKSIPREPERKDALVKTKKDSPRTDTKTILKADSGIRKPEVKNILGLSKKDSVVSETKNIFDRIKAESTESKVVSVEAEKGSFVREIENILDGIETESEYEKESVSRTKDVLNRIKIKPREPDEDILNEAEESVVTEAKSILNESKLESGEAERKNILDKNKTTLTESESKFIESSISNNGSIVNEVRTVLSVSERKDILETVEPEALPERKKYADKNEIELAVPESEGILNKTQVSVTETRTTSDKIKCELGALDDKRVDTDVSRNMDSDPLDISSVYLDSTMRDNRHDHHVICDPLIYGSDVIKRRGNYLGSRNFCDNVGISFAENITDIPRDYLSLGAGLIEISNPYQDEDVYKFTSKISGAKNEIFCQSAISESIPKTRDKVMNGAVNGDHPAGDSSQVPDSMRIIAPASSSEVNSDKENVISLTNRKNFLNKCKSSMIPCFKRGSANDDPKRQAPKMKPKKYELDPILSVKSRSLPRFCSSDQTDTKQLHQANNNFLTNGSLTSQQQFEATSKVDNSEFFSESRASPVSERIESANDSFYEYAQKDRSADVNNDQTSSYSSGAALEMRVSNYEANEPAPADKIGSFSPDHSEYAESEQNLDAAAEGKKPVDYPLNFRRASLPAIISLNRNLASSKESLSSQLTDTSKSNKEKSRIPRKQPGVRGSHATKGPVRPPMWLSKAELTQEIQRLGTLCEARTKELNRLKMETKHVSTGFDAFASLFRYMVEDLNALSIPQLSKDLEKTLKQLELTKQDLAYYEREVEELKAHHCQELNDLSNKLFEVYQSEVSELNAKHTEEINHLKNDHQIQKEHLIASFTASSDEVIALHKQQIASLEQEILKEREVNSSHKEEIIRLENEHRKQMEELSADFHAASEEAKVHHEKVVSALEKELSHQRAELESYQQRELKDLEEKHAESIRVLKEHIDQLQKKCAELKLHSLGMEDAMQKDIDSKLQWVAAQKIDLDKEVESLKAVLEMKNKELHSLRVQNLEMQKQLEDLPLLREKIKMYQARAEDLEALMVEKTKIERKLSTENQQMRDTYEKEAKVNRRLSMENEELQWRLRQAENSLLSGSFSEVPEYPEENPTSPTKSPVSQAMSRSVFFTYVDANDCTPDSPRTQYKKIMPGFSAGYKTSPAKSSRTPPAPSPQRTKSHSEPPNPPASLCNTPKRAGKQSLSRVKSAQKKQRSCTESSQTVMEQTEISTPSMASSVSSESSIFEHKEKLLEEHKEQIIHSLKILKQQRIVEGEELCSLEKKWCSDDLKICTELPNLETADLSRSAEFSDPKTYYHMTFPFIKEAGDTEEGARSIRSSPSGAMNRTKHSMSEGNISFSIDSRGKTTPSVNTLSQKMQSTDTNKETVDIEAQSHWRTI